MNTSLGLLKVIGKRNVTGDIIKGRLAVKTTG